MASKLIDLVALVLLAQALGPEQFGVVAIAMTLVLTVEAILDLPIAAVLVREPHVTPAMQATAFSIQALRSLAVTVLALATAFPISALYEEPRL